MAADQFCLRWNNFQINITSALESLKSDEDLVDVTLTCDGQNVKAHKVILSACSPYFRNVFKENPCQHPVVILKDVRYEDVQALLSFMYQGEVYISQDRLAPFLHTAELLQVRGLAGAANPFRETQQQSPAPPPPPPPPTALQPQVTTSHSKQRKPVSLPSVPPPVAPHLHTHTRPSLPASPAFVTSEQPATVSPELPVPVSVSPTLSQPSSPQHDDTPVPLSKRRKAFPRRFAVTPVPPQLSSQEEFSALPHQTASQTPAVPDSPLHDLPVTIKKEPICQDEGDIQEEQTIRGMDGNGSPSASGASEDTDCFGSNLGDEDSRGVPLKEESRGSSPPASQQQSMLMRSLSGAPPQHAAVPEGTQSSWSTEPSWSTPQPTTLTPRQLAIRIANRNMYQRRKHIWQSRRPVNCPNCHKVISMAYNLKSHMITCLRKTSNLSSKTEVATHDRGWTTI
ncbi:broad-complex core protein isoforms 1/2/3/4/5-like isoform X1 [Schistocerca gregaria]|uniref:broad-complex core protein isoforms 1/2/3/4/5-like isoform X1 n=1 Tax=Schistocerca gregaria TaxID=7010 RepID=UPI00211DEC1A|nr:broad-complex core protein isoforms 1/2/3/4/5-like isoform X1 [Schistocerca gregaria]XP_049840650.1 broad-complex core protein isoforms 1/2/3/4/5-like isoform X1 [Schistocerca gregaria]XP_049840651.1 broad-complex core protein isoforms 1/2/3/4/5-like isoform X1 [Schistocerca gregaria]